MLGWWVTLLRACAHVCLYVSERVGEGVPRPPLIYLYICPVLYCAGLSCPLLLLCSTWTSTP